MTLPEWEQSPSVKARQIHINQWLTPGVLIAPHHRDLDAAIVKAMLA